LQRSISPPTIHYTVALNVLFGATNLIAVDQPAQIARSILAHCRIALAGASQRKIGLKRVA
jgi:hypothetical protein